MRVRARNLAFPAGLAVAAGAIALLAKANLFPLLSGDADESVYIYQGRMLAGGHTKLAASTHALFFHPWLFGEHAGSLFSQYQPGWPAVIGFAHRLGSERMALVVAAAAAALAVWWLAREVEPRAAPYAAILFIVSPIFIIHSALFLAYLWTTALVAGGAAAALAGVRTRHWLPFVVSGVLFGGAQLTRPFDALLVAVPVVVYVAIALWGNWPALGRAALFLALGIAPLLLATLVYNAHITGTPTKFPLQAAEHLDTFGFGPRRMAPTEPVLQYSHHEAYRSLRKNTRMIPSWFAGGGLGLALALGALVVHWRRGKTWLLVALAAIFPLAYITWWATSLAAGAGAGGLGPHYYVPAFVPLAVLAGWFVSDVVQRNRWLGLALFVPILFITGVLLLHKPINDAHVATELQRAKHAPFTTHDPQHAVVVLRANPTRYILRDPTFLIGDPELQGARLYAIDRGPTTADLQRQFPGRQLYQYVLRTEPGHPLLRPSYLLEPMHVTRGPVVTLHFDVVNPAGAKAVFAAVRIDERTVTTQVLATASTKGATARLDVALVAPGATLPSPRPGLLAARVDTNATVHVVAGFGATVDPARADLVERRYYVARRGPDLAVQQPGLQYHRYTVNGTVWAAQDVDAYLHERGTDR